MAKPITLVLLGDIAAGKGTQARILAKKFRLKHIDIGGYSRKVLLGKSKISRRLERIKLGKLAPSDIIQKYLKSKILPARRSGGSAGGNLKSGQGVLIDGGKMPSEANLIYKLLMKPNRKILVIYLTIPRQEIYMRLTKRFYDAQTGKPLVIDPRKVRNGKYKGRAVIKRADDDLGAIKKRIDYYYKIYSKTVKFWQEKGLLKKINGRQSVQKVTKDMTNIINKYYEKE